MRPQAGVLCRKDGEGGMHDKGKGERKGKRERVGEKGEKQ